MKKYNPLPIKNIMFIWNIILAIFSAYCVKYISIPLITHNLFGNKISICTDIISIKDDTLAKWRFYFILSKFPEMLDTAWIILRKKPISFLQIWHHFSVCAYCWILVYSTNYNEGGHGTYFAAMNSFIHMIMYFYYAALTKFNIRNITISKTITTLQILQMLIGLFIHFYKTIYCVNHYIFEQTCGYIIYSSYMYLFIIYYKNRYIN